MCPHHIPVPKNQGREKLEKTVLVEFIQTPPFGNQKELAAPGDLYRYIPEFLRSLELMQKKKVMEMGPSKFFID
jgi:hypothetical protein